jgi:DASS family divalent anion:Na+ symporter
MDVARADGPPVSSAMNAPSAHGKLWRWALVLGIGVAVALLPRPAGVPASAWNLLAIFVATVVGLTLQPLPGGGMVLVGVTASILFGTQPIAKALAGYADPIVWLVLAAFFMSRGMIDTGLGRRIAFLLIRAMGRSLGPVLAASRSSRPPSPPVQRGARAGLFPITRAWRKPTTRSQTHGNRLGAFLMVMVYQCCVVNCAIFLTGQAANALIASFAMKTAGVDLSYGRWLAGAIVPGLISLIVVGLIVYRMARPEVKHTPRAVEIAQAELDRMGPMSAAEIRMLLVFGLVALCG